MEPHSHNDLPNGQEPYHFQPQLSHGPHAKTEAENDIDRREPLQQKLLQEKEKNRLLQLRLRDIEKKLDHSSSLEALIKEMKQKHHQQSDEFIEERQRRYDIQKKIEECSRENERQQELLLAKEREVENLTFKLDRYQEESSLLERRYEEVRLRSDQSEREKSGLDTERKALIHQLQATEEQLQDLEEEYQAVLLQYEKLKGRALQANEGLTSIQLLLHHEEEERKKAEKNCEKYCNELEGFISSYRQQEETLKTLKKAIIDGIRETKQVEERYLQQLAEREGEKRSLEEERTRKRELQEESQRLTSLVATLKKELEERVVIQKEHATQATQATERSFQLTLELQKVQGELVDARRQITEKEHSLLLLEERGILAARREEEERERIVLLEERIRQAESTKEELLERCRQGEKRVALLQEETSSLKREIDSFAAVEEEARRWAHDAGVLQSQLLSHSEELERLQEVRSDLERQLYVREKSDRERDAKIVALEQRQVSLSAELEQSSLREQSIEEVKLELEGELHLAKQQFAKKLKEALSHQQEREKLSLLTKELEMKIQDLEVQLRDSLQERDITQKAWEEEKVRLQTTVDILKSERERQQTKIVHLERETERLYPLERDQKKWTHFLTDLGQWISQSRPNEEGEVIPPLPFPEEQLSSRDRPVEEVDLFAPLRKEPSQSTKDSFF